MWKPSKLAPKLRPSNGFHEVNSIFLNVLLIFVLKVAAHNRDDPFDAILQWLYTAFSAFLILKSPLVTIERFHLEFHSCSASSSEHKKHYPKFFLYEKGNGKSFWFIKANGLRRKSFKKVEVADFFYALETIRE